MRLSRLPREARELRKPKQPNRLKYPNKSCWIHDVHIINAVIVRNIFVENWAECLLSYLVVRSLLQKKSFANSKVKLLKRIWSRKRL